MRLSIDIIREMARKAQVEKGKEGSGTEFLRAMEYRRRIIQEIEESSGGYYVERRKPYYVQAHRDMKPPARKI